MSNIGYYSAKLHHKLTRYQNIVESKLDSCVDIKDTAVLIELATDLSTTIFEVETHRLELLDDIKSLDHKMRPYDITTDSDTNNNDTNTSFKEEPRLIPEDTN